MILFRQSLGLLRPVFPRTWLMLRTVSVHGRRTVGKWIEKS
jgi:hypothetical protein